MHPLDDTIVAIASAPGGAARGIVRLSGPGVKQCLEACFRAKDGEEYPKGWDKKYSIQFPAILEGDVILSSLHSPLPCEVYLWPEGRSYTGKTVAEFHTLGSPPLLDSLLKTLCSAGARLAEPGEFTMRAFLSGRIDLTQAEAVLGVIDAADPRQLQTALGQLAGGLAGPLHAIRDDLLELLAHLEAGFDFAEEDISFISAEQLDRQLTWASEQVAALLEKMSSRNLAETAAKAVFVGRPNTGKSSLFNALTKDGRALVSTMPGTTRDYLAAELDLDGVKCQLIDTAGIDSIHSTPFGRGEIDSAAQTAASEQHQQATIRILCLDAALKPNDWEYEQIEKSDPASTLIVLTKIDEVGQVSNLSSIIEQVGNLSYGLVATSSATGEGIDHLRKELREKIRMLGNDGGEVVAGTAARCRESLDTAGRCLKRARMLLENRAGEEFVAGEIRLALEELGRVAGAVYTDDVLDRIFSRFCVGK
jgi:tRNA modification GTPase